MGRSSIECGYYDQAHLIREAVFENPQHDFPQRIIYRKNGDDSLTASIDGGEGTKATSFSFRRMKQ